MSVAPKYRYWLVGALILGVGAATPYAQEAARALANVYVTSRAAGTARPLDVMVVDTNGDPAALAATITGDVTIDTSALETLTGAVTETAPATDTASSGLNGRLQRIAQSLTSLIAKLPSFGTAGTPSANVLSVQGVASGTALPVSIASLPSHAVTNAGTFAVQAGQSGTWNVTNVSGTVSLPTGASTSSLQTTGNSSLSSIDGKLTALTTPSDSFTNQSGLPVWAMNGCWDATASKWVRCLSLADGTHDSAASATGPQVMGEAAVDVSANTAVADGDAVRLATDSLGRLLTVGPCDRSARVGSVTTVTDGSSTSAISAGGSGIYLEVYDAIFANTSATAVTVDLRDGTGGSVLATVPVPANTSGATIKFTVPVTSSANTAIAVDPSASASSIIVSLGGCKAK